MNQKALFLDRDGVINVDRDYVYRIEDFEWQPGIFDLARSAIARDLALIVVTNQSGIGRGYYSQADFEALTGYMRDRFIAERAPITAVYHCPYSPSAVTATYRAANHPWRKPNPGMILAARDTHALDLSGSILIGDRISDMTAGHRAGVGTLVLVGSHAGQDESVEAVPSHHFATVLETAHWLQHHAWDQASETPG